MLESLPLDSWKGPFDAGLKARAVTALERGAVLFFPNLAFALTDGEKPFLDAGVAWYNHDTPVFKFSTNSSQRTPVFSSGVSTRINVLGYLVAEIFWAYPFQRPQQKSGIWGFQILPGW